MPDFLLPDLGEGLTEAQVTAWHVAPGDEVRVDQIVVEVETAKAAVEVPVPFGGVVSAVHAKAGDTVAVGAPLISVDASPSAPEGVGFREPGVVLSDRAASDGDASGNVLIGYGTPASAPGRRGTRVRRRGPRTATHLSSDDPPLAFGDLRGTAFAVVSPLVRKLARDAGVDPAALTGSGTTGLVTRRDVEQAIAARNASGASDVESAVRRIPLTGRRKTMADKLSRSRREIPEATVWVDVDATGLLDARAALNAHDPQRPVGVLALLSRFAIAGLRRYPELNGRVDSNEIVLASNVHLGFAAQTDRGLVVPVIGNADRLSTRDLAVAMSTQASAARVGTLSPADLTGGTFTVNNYGVFGVDGSAAIINHPEIAILGIGRIVNKPWVVHGELAVRKVTQLTLAFDHRVCDGGTAGGFLRFVADCVESPAVALGDV